MDMQCDLNQGLQEASGLRAPVHKRARGQDSSKAGTDSDCRTGRTCDSQVSAKNNVFSYLARFSKLYDIVSALRMILLFALSMQVGR